MKGLYEYVYSPKFLRALKKCNLNLKEEVYESIDLFKNEDNHKKLKLHKLTGKFEDSYAFSVNTKIRIIVQFSGSSVFFLELGDHDIYK